MLALVPGLPHIRTTCYAVIQHFWLLYDKKSHHSAKSSTYTYQYVSYVRILYLPHHSMNVSDLFTGGSLLTIPGIANSTLNYTS